MPKFGGFEYESDEEKAKKKGDRPTYDLTLRPKGAGRGGSSEMSAQQASAYVAEHGGAVSSRGSPARQEREAKAQREAAAATARATEEARMIAMRQRFNNGPSATAHRAKEDAARREAVKQTFRANRNVATNPKPEASQQQAQQPQQGAAQQPNRLAAMVEKTRAQVAAHDQRAADNKLTIVERLKKGGPEAKIDQPDGSSLRLDTKTNEVVKTHKNGREERKDADQHHSEQKARQKAHAQ